MDHLLKSFKTSTLWMLAGVAGSVFAVISWPVKLFPGFLFGLGLLLFAVGQWKDRFGRTSPILRVIGTNRLWQPSAVGISLDGAGAALFVAAIIWLGMFGL
jgi:hypothetical protein